jgi:hypothetical protein
MENNDSGYFSPHRMTYERWVGSLTNISDPLVCNYLLLCLQVSHQGMASATARRDIDAIISVAWLERPLLAPVLYACI